MNIINYNDFQKIELIVGKIIKVEDFEKAKKPTYKIYVYFGEKFGEKKTSAQIVQNYKKDELINKLVIGCLNLGEKNIAGFISEFLLTGFKDKNENVVLSTVDKDVKLGEKLF